MAPGLCLLCDTPNSRLESEKKRVTWVVTLLVEANESLVRLTTFWPERDGGVRQSEDARDLHRSAGGGDVSPLQDGPDGVGAVPVLLPLPKPPCSQSCPAPC